MPSIAQNLVKVKSQITKDVTLVAVSKTKPAELILEAYNAGQRDFGENYVQEFIEKQQVLPSDINWHFIGHLQSNKVKYIAPFVYLIHGVDSISLLKEINKQAIKCNRKIKCLLQVHIATEETKFGFSISEIKDLISSNVIAELKSVEVCGFMGMASNTDDITQIEKEFSNLNNLFIEVKKGDDTFKLLSIGMSSDYLIAIKNGGNLIRVGSAIFGSR